MLGDGHGTPGFLELGTLDEKSLAVRDRVNRDHVLIEQIDLLKRETLCLGNAEVRENDAHATRRTPNVKHFGAEICISGARIDQVVCYTYWIRMCQSAHQRTR